MAHRFFEITNTVALLAWIALVLFPGRSVVSHLLCGIVVPAVLAACYAAVIGWKLSENGPPPGDVMTIAGLRAVFADDWVFAAAWTHYLCFDMVGFLIHIVARLTLRRAVATNDPLAESAGSY